MISLPKPPRLSQLRIVLRYLFCLECSFASYLNGVYANKETEAQWKELEVATMRNAR